MRHHPRGTAGFLGPTPGTLRRYQVVWRAEFSKKKLAWGKLTGQELTDMLVYLQNLPETRNVARTFSFPPSDSGEKLFSSKGCTECHVGKRALEVLLKNQN